MSSTLAASNGTKANGGAAGATLGKTSPPDPLAFMNRLNKSVYVHRPATSAARASNEPRLVLLCSWMGAHPNHIAKYVKPYTELYPNSPVVLVRSELHHFTRPGTLAEVQLGADAVRSEFPELSTDSREDATVVSADAGSTAPPPLLIHLWSNGGSTVLYHMTKRLPSLPKNAIIFDSCPGQFRAASTYSAMLAVLPPMLRVVLAPVVFLLCAYWWLKHQFRIRVLGGRSLDPLALTAAAHNTPERLAAEVRRTYIYSKEDALIPAADVEAHAAEAKSLGADVTLELFKGAHVGHLRTDPERYWRVVKETYSGVSALAPEAPSSTEPTSSAVPVPEEVATAA